MKRFVVVDSQSGLACPRVLLGLGGGPDVPARWVVRVPPGLAWETAS